MSLSDRERQKRTIRHRGGERRITQGAQSEQQPITARRAQWKQSAHGPVCRSMWNASIAEEEREGERAPTPVRAHTHTHKHTSQSTWHRATQRPTAVIMTQFLETPPESRWRSPWWSASDAQTCAASVSVRAARFFVFITVKSSSSRQRISCHLLTLFCSASPGDGARASTWLVRLRVKLPNQTKTNKTPTEHKTNHIKTNSNI